MRKKKKTNDILHLKVNQLMLPTGKVITFNDEQYEGINKIRSWLKNGEIFFTLAGHAGTGKTCSIKKILDEYRGNVVVSAPTHKAVGVISDLTDKEGKTLQSLLGLRPDCNLDSFNPDNPDFHPIAEPKIFNYDLAIVDEASMINQELYDMISTLTKNTGIKILFLGDPAQIPPINERESAVFNQVTNEFHQLTIIERQNDDNPLIKVYDALRNNLNTIGGGFIRKSCINKKGEGIIFTDDKVVFRKAILERYRNPEFQNSTDYAKVIAWKNKTVMSANKVIRTELFGKNANIVEVGDILMCYRSVRSSNGKYNIINNSDDYRVINKMEMSINKYGILGYIVRIREDLPHGKFKNKDIFIVDSNNEDNLHNYAELHDKFKKIGKEKKKIGSWSEYYDFRRQNILMKTITKYRNGTPRNKYEQISRDVDYGLCITCHKSQGSTYSHIFVLETDIDENWRIKERNQLKYTAITRPIISATVLTTKIDL
jgi:AAA domain/UvrD-like helicase C-terminal domain